MDCDVRHAMADSSSSSFLPSSPFRDGFRKLRRVFELYEQYPNVPADQEPNWGLNSADVIFFFELFYGFFNFHCHFLFWDFRKPCHSATIFHCQKKKLAVRGCSNVYLLIFYSQNTLTTWKTNGMCTDGPRKAATREHDPWTTVGHSREFSGLLPSSHSLFLFSSLQFSSPFLFLESS